MLICATREGGSSVFLCTNCFNYRVSAKEGLLSVCMSLFRWESDSTQRFHFKSRVSSHGQTCVCQVYLLFLATGFTYRRQCENLPWFGSNFLLPMTKQIALSNIFNTRIDGLTALQNTSGMSHNNQALFRPHERSIFCAEGQLVDAFDGIWSLISSDSQGRINHDKDL